MFEMRQKATELGLKAWSSDLVEDLVNVNAGGTYVSPGPLEEACEERAVEISSVVHGEEDSRYRSLPGGRSLYHNAYYDSDSGSASRRAEAESKTAWKDHLNQYHTNAQEFVNAADFSECEGKSPLERAMNYVRLMSEKDLPEHSDTHGADETANPLFSSINMKGMADEINERVILVNETSMEELQDLEPGVGKEVGSEAKGSKAEIASNFTAEDWVWLRMSKKIDSLPSMVTSLSREQVADPDGREVRVRPIESWDEVNKLTPREWTYPPVLRAYRIASRVAMIREKVKTVVKRQLLYILVDGSGSMSGRKTYQAGGIVMNRLRAVKRGDAVVYVRFFDASCWKDEYHAWDEASAVKCMADVKDVYYGGGGTAIDHCARQATARVEEILGSGDQLTKPELLVVTDGQDGVSLTLNDLKGTTMHAFVLGTNQELVNIARQSGGVGIEIGGNDDY
jgi:Mg-chelatase subunit ChlD